MSLVLGEGNIGDSMSSELRERKRKRRYEYAGPRYPSQLEEEETRMLFSIGNSQPASQSDSQ